MDQHHFINRASCVHRHPSQRPSISRGDGAGALLVPSVRAVSGHKWVLWFSCCPGSIAERGRGQDTSYRCSSFIVSLWRSLRQCSEELTAAFGSD